jgi:hypothetical protein
MNDLFSSLLVLVPLAVFIAVRIAADKKRKAVSGEAEPRAQAATAGEFSAHALKPDDDIPARRVPASKKRSRPALLSIQPAADLPGGEADSAAIAVEPEARSPAAAHGGVFARFDVLPPRKRAVVFAELFGEPKGR